MDETSVTFIIRGKLFSETISSQKVNDQITSGNDTLTKIWFYNDTETIATYSINLSPVSIPLSPEPLDVSIIIN